MPTRPTGGPPDEEGPEVIGTSPQSGTTNFSDNTILFKFNEFIDRGSLEDALRIEPNLNLEIKRDWSRKALELKFIDPLPDSTTIIVTLGIDLTDTRNNKMAKPVTVAISTGPTIDSGELKTSVKRADTGKGVAGQRVLLYQRPVDFTRPAIYMGESDTSGTVNFSYLAAGEYKAFWLNDKNRNRKWDRQIEEAQPFSREFVQLKREEADSLGNLYIVSEDTIPPALQAVGLFSTRRMRMRFSENIFPSDSLSISVTDTLGNSYTNAEALYRPDESPFVLFAQAQKNLREGVFYEVNITGLFDKGGNGLAPSDLQFEGSAQEDTTLQRIIRFENKSGLFPEEPLIFTYSKSFSNTTIADSLIGIKGDQLHEPWPQSSFDVNKLLIHPLKDSWEQGIPYEFRVFNPKILLRETYEPKIWFESDLGELEFVQEDSTFQNSLVLQLKDTNEIIRRDTTFNKSVIIERLPPLRYTAIIFQDRNLNGKWDRGKVSPYQKPEPYYIRRNIQPKAGFTATVPVEFIGYGK